MLRPIMLGLRHIIDALRVAALWLLVVCVCFGPAGLAGSAALASANKTCGASCPCDDANLDDRAEADGCDDDPTTDLVPTSARRPEQRSGAYGLVPEHRSAGATQRSGRAAVANHAPKALTGAPCKDECPSGCPSCGCCVHLTMAVLPLPTTSSNATRTAAAGPAPTDATTSGALSGVFRPPALLS